MLLKPRLSYEQWGKDSEKTGTLDKLKAYSLGLVKELEPQFGYHDAVMIVGRALQDINATVVDPVERELLDRQQQKNQHQEKQRRLDKELARSDKTQR